MSRSDALFARHAAGNQRSVPQAGQQNQRHRHGGDDDEGLQRVDAAIAHRDQQRRDHAHHQAPEHTHAARRIVVTAHHHRDRVGHRVTGGGDEQRGQHQEQHRDGEAERQLLGDGDQRCRQVEAGERTGDAARVAQLEGQAAATDDGEPQAGDQRRDDRDQQHHLTQGAATRDTRHEHRHQRTIADEPAPEEQRPAIQPAIVTPEGGHGDEVTDVAHQALREGFEQEAGRAHDQDEQQQRAAEQDVGAAQELDATGHAADSGQGVDDGQHEQQRELGRVGIGNAEQRIEAIADLQTEKADGADGTGHHCQHAAGIDQRTDGATHDAVAEQRIEQRARLERQALLVVQVHEDDAGQAAEHRPGQKAPVHEALRQRVVGGIGIACRGVRAEHRRRRGEVSDRLCRCPEDTTTRQQRAQDDGHPAQRRDIRRRQPAHAHPSGTADGQHDGDDEGRQHQRLPVGTEVLGRDTEGTLDERGDSVEIHQCGDGKHCQYATTDDEDGPVDTLRGVCGFSGGIYRCGGAGRNSPGRIRH